MSESERLSLPYMASGQAQKHVTHNEALRRLDALVQASVKSRQVDEPPASPSAGDGYLLPEAVSGDWTGKGGMIAVWQDGAWAYLAAATGFRIFVEDEAALLVRAEEGWQRVAPLPNPVDLVGINTSASLPNRLAIKSDAVLFSHDDVTPGTGSIRHTLNRQGDTDTASLVLQSGYSGRAELGLVGDSDFSVRVSADGSAWQDAIRIDPADGVARFRGSSIAEISEAFARLYESKRHFREGNIAKTRSVSLASNAASGSTLVLASAADANMLFIDGSYVKTLSLGEMFHGAYPAGTRIETGHGHTGVSAMTGGPMPLGHEALAGTLFLLFAFRGSDSGYVGRVHVAAGSVPAIVTLYDGTGSTIIDGPVELGAFERAQLTVNANAEFRLVSDQPVFAAISSFDDVRDYRLLHAPDTELIGWNRNARVSALYAGTTVDWYRRSGESGSFVVSPGSPVNLFEISGAGDNTGYEQAGAIILRADGPISALSGADGAGFDATAYQSVSSLGQRFAVPLATGTSSNTAESCIAVASPYEGTARIHASDGTLVHEMAITRNTSPAATASDQLFPASALFNPATHLGSGMSFGPGGYVDCDVPAYVVLNSMGDSTIYTEGDEIVLAGIVPDVIKCELTRDDAGLIRRREVTGGSGMWVIA
ncbi:DUF2793 domain-containing protein [Parvularcula flava]|uniref:DUF2793 domain-containing protein n=1 Tax=Aquisalinus luteolus TaxID=1566827 RepID=A0A8J3A461_9PROT|nr:DUF2793 domain-containing protein [Aquisalinus luteolus]NHK29531.1 DUF2793 domain-containing protein [Aquisalinus luteolus]GGI01658.1 hypothetical protein GCM10011355_32830 [Aquisalinus luteolus]